MADYSKIEELYNLPPGLLKAMAMIESSNNSKARSPTGALGLMQIEPSTAERFGHSTQDIMDPDIAPIVAAKILNGYRSKSRNQEAIGGWLGNYNTGLGSKNDPARQRYVQKVLKEMYPIKPMPSIPGQGNYAGGGLVKGALTRMAKAPVEPDPLSALIATRMAGQLQAISKIPGLSALEHLNLPAAYAGDQRSLVPVQRAISEAETGLASPGRRKFVKQAAATAARSAVPDSVASALGTTALKKAVQDAVSPSIPDESIQAAYAMAFGKALKNKTLMEAADHGISPKDLFDNSDFYVDSIGFSPKQLNSAKKAFESISPAAVARASGLPEDAIAQYLSKTKQNPSELLFDWFSEPGIQRDFFESPREYQFSEHVFGPQPKDIDEFVKKIPPGISDFEELGDGLYDSAVDLIEKKQRDLNTGHYRSFFGPDQYEKLRRTPGVIDPDGLFQERMETLYDNELFQNYADELMGEIRSQYKP